MTCRWVGTVVASDTQIPKRVEEVLGLVDRPLVVFLVDWVRGTSSLELNDRTNVLK